MKPTIWILTVLLAAAVLPGAVYEKYLVSGNPQDDAILRLQAQLKDRPDSSELHNNLGVKIWEKRFPKDAIREFKRALKLDKRNYQAWFNLGLVYEALDQNFKAWRAFKKTVKYKPGHDLAHYHLGMIDEKWGLHHAAVERYAKAIAFNQSIMDPRYNAAIVYNDILPEVLALLYQKYRTARVQPFQTLAVPAAPSVAPPAPQAKPAAEPPLPAPAKTAAPEPKPKKEGVMQPQPAPPAPAPPAAPPPGTPAPAPAPSAPEPAPGSVAALPSVTTAPAPTPPAPAATPAEPVPAPDPQK